MNLTTSGSDGVRLQVFLAQCGVASRRAAEEYIKAGRVKINGVVVSRLGSKCLPGDQVSLDDQPLVPEEKKHYILLHKPVACLCSRVDASHRRLIYDLVKDIPERLFSVGRLDYFSSGLILLTNDGDFARRIAHPSSRIEKEYLVECREEIPDELGARYCRGLKLEGQAYKAQSWLRIDPRRIQLSLHEGKNREIRRVFLSYKLTILSLQRQRIGPLSIDGLSCGQYRELSEEERMEMVKRASRQLREGTGQW